MRRVAVGWALPAAVVVAAASWQTASLLAKAGVDPSWQVALHLTWTRGSASAVGSRGRTGRSAFSRSRSPSPAARYRVVPRGALAEIALAYLLIRRAPSRSARRQRSSSRTSCLPLPVQPADLLLLIELVLAVLALERVGRLRSGSPRPAGSWPGSRR